MITVAVVAGGGVGYYLDTVGSGVDDYYLASAPGRWYGAGCALVGVSGDATAGDVRRALPNLTADAKPGRVAAYDLTFSAPKTVSILAGLGDEATRDEVVAAHRRAVAETVGFVEAEAARARRGHGGTTAIGVAGVAAVGFDHHSSRAGDPQLHTHLLVANRALGDDGRWGALDGSRLYAWARTAGFVYQAALRAELTGRLGVRWGPVRSGSAEIAGVADETIEAFSTRRAQITAALDAAGASGPRAAQVAALATRPAKPAPLDPAWQRARWWDTARATGLTPEALAGVRGPARVPGPADLPGLAARLSSPAGLTARRSSFDRRDMLRAVAEAAGDGIGAAGVAGAADALGADRRFVATATASRLGGPRWSTVELVGVESGLLAAVAARQAMSDVALCPPGAIDSAIGCRPGLSAEQQAMVRQLCGAGRGVEVVVGPAGTGKTWALDAAAAAWAASGVPVVGAALAARTARALEAGTGIASTTVDQLLSDAARPGARFGTLPARGVVVIDEAGMVGTRKLARLAAAAGHARAKLVLVGDPAQLPELEAGGVLAALASAGPAVHLSVNRRQASVWERSALAGLRAGDAPRAVGVLAAHGRITLTSTAEQARERLVADWAGAYRPDRPDQALMVALSRADVADLNRRALRHLGLLGVLDPRRDRLQVDRPGETIAFGVGERVLALRNDRRIGVTNGTAGTVTAVDSSAGTVTVAPDPIARDGPADHPHSPNPAGPNPASLNPASAAPVTVVLPAGYLADGHLAHGWAVTVHKAQGVTTDRAFLLGTDRLYRESGYVGLSRAVSRTDWYHPSPDPGPWDDRSDPLDRLGRLLSRSQAQQLATDGPPGPGQPADAAGRRARHATVLADPAADVVEALGPPPLVGAARRQWTEVAAAVEDYRARHPASPHPASPHPVGQHPAGPRPAGLADPAGAGLAVSARGATQVLLGPPPGEPDARRDWELIAVAVAESRRQLGVDIDIGAGLHP